MNGWRSRLMLAAVMALAMWLHSMATASLPNTDEGMLQFHGSAAAVDFLLLYFAPRFVGGRLCDDTQILCLVSCVTNFVGFIAYTAYAPPIFYNGFMWGLAHVQFGRILLVDHHGADYLGFDLVRGGHRRRRQNYIGAASL